MAKKKKRKEEKKNKTGYEIELVGLLLIIASIIGFCAYGPLGALIRSFFIFLFGTWYGLLFLAVFIVGIYMIIKRSKPNFFTSKLFGLYIIVIGILIMAHTNYLSGNDLKGFDVIKETITNFFDATTKVRSAQGGGIIGALFSLLFVNLVDLKGTTIVVWTMIICGTVMFTGVSIWDFVQTLKKKAQSTLAHKQEVKEKHRIEKIEKQAEKEEEEPNEEVEDKVVVSSVEELIHVPDTKKESTESEVAINDGEEYYINECYKFPPMNLLSKPTKGNNKENQNAIKDNVVILEQVLKDFGIEGKTVAANIGPAVTQYELEIKAGTKVSKILSIHREIALALAAKEVRIEAPIPGKKTIGIEIPNKKSIPVCVREVLESVPKTFENSKLLAVLGRDIMGKPQWMEINKTPHLLVAGSTGSGKSVCINSLIVSILMRAKPEEAKLVLVDPKKVELSMYNGVPHLLTPVVTDPKKANIVLKKMVVEMERRYEAFEESGTKNIAGYNDYIDKKNEGVPERDQMRKLPYIVVIIDELADLMLVAAKEVEDSIMRITQMARAAGIHLIVATQRPSTDVITGVVKANIPSRISFAVSSSIDSRTILDMTGAEKLLGKGDMLFKPQGENIPIRIQGTFISDDEIKAVVDYVCTQQKARYDDTLTMDEEEKNATTMVEDGGEDEPLYNDIVEFVITQGKASASLLQRRFRLGYNRAARCIDLLEERGIIGPSNGSKPREVLVKLEEDSE